MMRWGYVPGFWLGIILVMFQSAHAALVTFAALDQLPNYTQSLLNTVR